jgi:hypothetical protein
MGPPSARRKRAIIGQIQLAASQARLGDQQRLINPDGFDKAICRPPIALQPVNRSGSVKKKPSHERPGF